MFEKIRAYFREDPFHLPTVLFVAASWILILSLVFPYWSMELRAPQYPQGLKVTIYLTHLAGDVKEVDTLNHYVGMAPLDEAAKIERTLAPVALATIALVMELLAFVRRKWAAVLALPAILFPVVFLGDMYFWLYNYGHNLDPNAPLNHVIEPFTPPLFGRGTVGQFETIARLGIGFWMAVAAAILMMVGLHFRRRARLQVEGR